MNPEKPASRQWIGVSIEFKVDIAEMLSAVDIICDLFYSEGIKGVVIDESQDDTGICGRVTGYVFKDVAAPETLTRLKQMTADVVAGGIIKAAVHTEELDEQDWANFWKDHFHPVKIGRRLVIKPTWHEYCPAGEEIIIEIDPGMAFGTGTHATTSMCLEMIENLLQPQTAFLDIGTGSGILMIAAGKLGASLVWGIDNDPMAVEIAIVNLRLNRIAGAEARVMSVDLLAENDFAGVIDRRFDFIAANIQSETVAALIPRVSDLIVPGGLFVCSGIIEQRTGLVQEALSSRGFTLRETMVEQPWVCMASVAPGGKGKNL